MQEIPNNNRNLANAIFKENVLDKQSTPAKNKNLKQEFFGKGRKISGLEKKNISLFSRNKEEKIIDDEDIVSYKILADHKEAELKVAHKLKDGTYKYFEIKGTKVNPEQHNKYATFQIGDNQEKFAIKNIKFAQKVTITCDDEGKPTESWRFPSEESINDSTQIMTSTTVNAERSLAGMNTLIGMLREKKEFDRIGRIKSPGSMLSKLLGFPEVAPFPSRGIRAKLILQRLFDPYCVIWDRIVVKRDESGEVLTDRNGDPITEIDKPAVPARILKHFFVVGAGIGGVIFFSIPITLPTMSILLAVILCPGLVRWSYSNGMLPAGVVIALAGGNPIIIGAALSVIFGAVFFSWLSSSALNKSARLSLEGKNKQAFAMLVLAWFLLVIAAVNNGVLGIFIISPASYSTDGMDFLNETKSKKHSVVVFFFFTIIPSAIKTAPKAFVIVLAAALLPLLAVQSGLTFVVFAQQQSGMIDLALKALSYYGSFVGFFGVQLSAGSLINLIMSSSLPLSTIYILAVFTTVWMSRPIVFTAFRLVKWFVDFAKGRTFKSPTLYQTMNIADLKHPTISDYLYAIVEGSLTNGVGFFIEKFGKLIVKSLVLDKLDKLSDSEEMNEILNAENEVIKDLYAKNVADFEWAAQMYQQILQSTIYVKDMEQTAANLREYLSIVNPALCRKIMESTLSLDFSEASLKLLGKDEQLIKLFCAEKEKINETCYADVIDNQQNQQNQHNPHMKELAKELNTIVGRYWESTNAKEREGYKEQIEIIAEYCKGLNKVTEFKDYLDTFNQLHAAKCKSPAEARLVEKTIAELSLETFEAYFQKIDTLEDAKKPALGKSVDENKISCLLVKNSRYNNDKLKSAMAGFRTWLNKSKTGKRCLMHLESGKPVSVWQKLTSPTWWRTGHVEFKPKIIEKFSEEEHNKNINRIVKKAQDIAINSIFIDPDDMTKTAEKVIYEKVSPILHNKLATERPTDFGFDIVLYIKSIICKLNLNKPWNQLTTIDKQKLFQDLKKSQLSKTEKLQDKKMLGQCILQVLTVETNQILLKEVKSVFETDPENPQNSQDLRLQAFYKLYETATTKDDYKTKTTEIITQEIQKEQKRLTSALELEQEVNDRISNKLAAALIEARKNLEVAKQQNSPLVHDATEAVRKIEKAQDDHKNAVDTFTKKNKTDQENLKKYVADLKNAIELLFKKHTEKIAAKLLIDPPVDDISQLGNIDNDMLGLNLVPGEDMATVQEKRTNEIRENTKAILSTFWKRAIEEAIIPIKSQLSCDTSEIVAPIEQPSQNDDLSREAAELFLQKTTYVKSQKIKNKEKEIFEQALNEQSVTDTINQYKNTLNLTNKLHQAPNNYHPATQYYKDNETRPHNQQAINNAISNLYEQVDLDTSRTGIVETIESTTKDIQAELQLSATETKAFEYPKTTSQWAASRGWTKFIEYYLPKFTRFIIPVGTRLSTFGRSLVNIVTNIEQYSQFGSSQITSAASLDQNGATAKLSREFGPGTQEKNELFLARQLELKKSQEEYAITYERLSKDQTKWSQKINKYKSTIPNLSVDDLQRIEQEVKKYREQQIEEHDEGEEEITSSIITE